MPERWERELRKLGGLDVDEAPVRERVDRGPTGDRLPPRRDRLVAGVVAVAVFVAAGVFAWRAFAPGSPRESVGETPSVEPQPTADQVVVDIQRSSEGTGEPAAFARFDGQVERMC